MNEYEALAQKYTRLDIGNIAAVSDAYAQRRILCRKYSYAVPTLKALRVIKQHAPLLEIGAGTGYWAYLLRQMKVDIVAHDNFKKRHDWFPDAFRPWTDIEDACLLKSIRYANDTQRNVLLCWPPMSNMALRVAQKINGTLLYIGERDGGCTADDAFFQYIQQHWECVDEVSIPQWDMIHDALYIFNRK